MNLRGTMLLVCVLAFAQQTNADVVHARRAFVQELCNDVWQSKVQKVYVPDFTDESGKFSSLGRFFAATFAKMLDEASMGFAVVDRVQVRRNLNKTGRTDQEPADPDLLTKLVSDMGGDAILWGKVSMNRNVATINLVMRTPSGKDLAQRRYEENLDGELLADLEASQSGTVFYYAGLDGVSPPNCVHCPPPEWPVGQGSPARDGDVILSILVTLEGNADQMRIAQTLDPVFDRAALECVRSWRFEPAKNADGKPVPVRLPVQITFKRRWQIR
jgi:TonB family protein